MKNNNVTRTLLLVTLMSIGLVLTPLQIQAGQKDKAHYNDAGFFDLHVCNWPDQKPFILAVFSTYRYDEVKSVTMYRPDGSTLGTLNLSRYRVIAKKGKPEKRAFLSQFEITAPDKAGWYNATIELKDGKRHKAKDFVKFETINLPDAVFPTNQAELDKSPVYLEWQPLAGAKYYKVFIRDKWDGEKLIHESKLVNTNRYQLPAGLLGSGGWYSWMIHARDVNEDPILGDFNSGSLSVTHEFSIQ